MADKPLSSDTESSTEPLTSVAWEAIRDALRGLRFGQVLLVVHEGAIVQIERTERKRISRSGDGV